MLDVWWVLKSCFFKKCKVPKKPNDLRPAFAKKSFQLSRIISSITKLPTCFIKNPTLPFETPLDHHARIDNTIFNKTKTLLK